MRISMLTFAYLALVACGGVTDVVKTGPDTYLVASHGTMGWSSGAAQKAKAFQDAEDYCKRMNKQVQPIGTNETPGGFGRIASGEVEFRCIDNPSSAYK